MSRIIKSTFFAVFFAAFFVFCKKDAPILPTRQIDGQWHQESPSPKWHYSFQSGLVSQQIVIGGTQVVELSYPYAVRGDTIIIGGDSTNTPRTWVLDWWCDSVVQVTQLNVAISPRLLLRKR